MRYIEIKSQGYVYRREFTECYEKDEFTGLFEPAEDNISCKEAFDACCMLLRACYSGKEVKEAMDDIRSFEYDF